jgi:tetratricopeptide (TPR) repeat protein
MRTRSSCRVALLSLILPLLFVLPSSAGVTQDAYERGLQAAEENQFQRAVGELTQAIELNPNDADAYAQRGRCNSRLNDYAATIADCTKALKIDPKHCRAYQYRGFAELYLNELQKGEADCKQALLYDRADGFDILTPGLYKNLSKLNRMHGNIVDAEIYMRRARALECLRLAKEAREVKQMDKAISLVNKALVDSPNEPSAFLIRGIFEDNSNDYPKAIADFTQAIKLDPKLVPAYYYRADVYSQLGRQKQAVADYTTIISLKPRIVAFRLVTETGRLRDHFLGSDDHIVNLEDIHYLRGKAQAALANRAEAVADFDIASKLDPQDNDPIARKAEIQSKAGQTNLALKTLSKSVSNDDTDWQTLASRAQVFEVQKDYQRAMRDYSRIIALNPKQPGAYFLRAQLSAKLGDLKAAIKDYSQMLLLEPDSDEAYKSRADCYYRLGQYRQAVVDCTAGIKCEADNASLYTLRASAYDKLGEKVLAARDRERASVKADKRL